MYKNETRDWSKIYEPMSIDLGTWNDRGNRDDILFINELEKMVSLTNNDNCGGSNIISLVGERGSGKTSVLNSYRTVLESEAEYHVFKIVNPDLFETGVSVLIIYITELFNLVKDNQHHMQEDYNFPTVINKLEKTLKLLVNVNNMEGFLNKSIPSIDRLNDIEDGLNFRKVLENLTQSVLELLNNTNKRKKSKKDIKGFVLIIDDIDLSSPKSVNKLFNEVNMYLSGSVNVVLAYRETQLLNSLLDNKIEEYENLLKSTYGRGQKPIISIDELTLQTNKIVEKAIPISRRVYLPNIQQINKLKISHIMRPFGFTEEWILSKDKNKTIFDLLYHELFLRTNLDFKPIDEKENASFFFPTSLRGLVQLMEFIDSNMKVINGNKKENIEGYRYNITELKKFINTKINEDFSGDELEFFKAWQNSPTSSKNQTSYKYLYSKLPDEVITRTEYKDAFVLEPRNISLGDVFMAMEDYSLTIKDDVKSGYFIYIFKILYSIELSSALLAIFQESEDISRFLDNNMDPQEGKLLIQEAIEESIYLEDYMSLVNGLVMPEEFNFYSYRREYVNDKSSVYRKAYLNYGMLPKEYKEGDYKLSEKIFNDFLYTGLTMTSDIATNISNPMMNFRYRSYYSNSYSEFMDSRRFRPTNNFRIHPYAYLSRREYITETLSDYLVNSVSENAKEGEFIIHNVFTLDYLSRKIYHRRSDDSVSYALKAVSKGLFSEYDFMIKNDKIKPHYSFRSLHFYKKFTDGHEYLSEVINEENKKLFRKCYPPYKDLIEKDENNITKSLFYGSGIEYKIIQDLLNIAETGSKNEIIVSLEKETKKMNVSDLNDLLAELKGSQTVPTNSQRKRLKEVILSNQDVITGR